MVVCQPRFDAPAERAPCLVAEVLSDSTASIDQIEKLASYAQVSSVLVYLVISQSERRVVVHRRDGDTFHAIVLTSGARLELDCPAIGFAVDELYVGTRIGSVAL